MNNPMGNNFIPGQAPSGPFGNMQNMMSQFQQFSQNFRGNAYQQVMQLLNSGQMTQEQFNQLSNFASQFQRMMGGR